VPGVQITAKELATGAVTANKAKYDEVTGKLREARMVCPFPAANVPTAFPHALGRIPTGFTVVALGRNGGAPGTVYTDDLPLAFSKYAVVLKCSTANTWADIKIF
jgi:hypothetical protein